MGHDVLELDIADGLQPQNGGMGELVFDQIDRAGHPWIFERIRRIEAIGALEVGRRYGQCRQELRVAPIVEAKELDEDQRGALLLARRIEAEGPTAGRGRRLAASEGGEGG